MVLALHSSVAKILQNRVQQIAVTLQGRVKSGEVIVYTGV
jgi:hypothetical protein